MLVKAQGAELPDYPQYVSPEDGQLDPDEVERELDAFLAERGGVIRM